jgi:hypothetical protein
MEACPIRSSPATLKEIVGILIRQGISSDIKPLGDRLQQPIDCSDRDHLLDTRVQGMEPPHMRSEQVGEPENALTRVHSTIILRRGSGFSGDLRKEIHFLGGETREAIQISA